MSSSATSLTNDVAGGALVERFDRIRAFSRQICEPLQTEDCVIQSMPDVSPTRWHLAHTTWFFETFLLKPYVAEYRSQNDAFEYLFNSYYNTVGEQFPRSQRGLLSRPTVSEVWDYRSGVEEAVRGFLQGEVPQQAARVLELGLQHEQQHQELMLTDIKHVLSRNPLFPEYHAPPSLERSTSRKAGWVGFDGGVRSFGHNGVAFCFDNECPRFDALLQDYRLANRLVTNREYLEFVDAGGYETPTHWLSMGWATVQAERWNAPLYWMLCDDVWHEFTLHGLQPIDLDSPVCHVSYFEADAFARWSGARLPTELEWEHAASGVSAEGNFAESLRFHPVGVPASDDVGVQQCFGDLWEWTASPYTAYPGYAPPDGALGEYNGKFMCNQFVLRGGSCATSGSHIRPTYRNFFPPDARWQFSGIRLAQNERPS